MMMTRPMIFALSLALGSVPAAASPVADTATIVVQIDDLNLAARSDQQRLEARIDRAARQLCRAGGRGLAERARETQCVAATLANAKRHADRAIAQANDGRQLAALTLASAR